MELKWGRRALPPKNTQAELQTVQIIPKYRPNEINKKQSLTFFFLNITWNQIFSGWHMYENLLAVYLFIFKPSPEVTRGWSKLTLCKYTQVCNLDMSCRGWFAGLKRMRIQALFYPCLKLSQNIGPQIKFSKVPKPHNWTDDPLSFSKKTILEKTSARL